MSLSTRSADPEFLCATRDSRALNPRSQGLQRLQRQSKLCGVQRFSAVLLLILFSSSLITPLLSASDPDSKFPACCRRNGRHHCSMTGSMHESSVPVVQTARCGLYPGPAVAQATRQVVLGWNARAAFWAPINQTATRPRTTSSLSCNAVSRAHQKRGPPSVLS